MKILIDTNILLRMAQPAHPLFGEATNAVRLLLTQGHDLVIVPQIVYEFWVVATRPASVNGLGFNVAQADADIGRLIGPFALVPDLPIVYLEWRRLVVQFGVVGKNAHDARLVAAMLVHGVTHLLTFNDQDFQRFLNISVHTPTSVFAIPPTP